MVGKERGEGKSKRAKLTDIVIEVMEREGLIGHWFGYDSFGLLQEVWEIAFERGIVKDFGVKGGKQTNHPANKMLRVLNAMDNDSRFEKSYIKCCGGFHNREAKVRIFRLKESCKGTGKISIMSVIEE